MSRHPLPNPTAQPGWHPFTILRILAVAGGVVSAAIGTAIAADPLPPSGTPTTPSAAVKDVALARSALAAIDAATDLKGVNLVVSVVDGIAVIGGPVASEKQSRRAEEVVRGVTGIVDVRNSCFVAAGPDPLLRSVAQRMGSTLPPRPTLYQVPGVLTNHLTPPAPYAEAIENRAVAMAATTSRETVVALKPPVEPGILGPPL
ncbi:MAG TPA: BON domain-containing protein, partial [Gemmata sp.]|nr:BON domain-containing protein [Gemmata sp.]